ncbi:conserved hypothetical protein [Streptomyces viridochromogenes DSM 40736]|uniref:Uncharacterized protein n=1 Tax=Streptomyces viridochromogenes (strain DSM 40736 / JCM 4977 / BCRC 1201 / Tue 494) TaxID=591159 RepID=D9X053_STRVT|nr:conserved hypothetical protein [Streptomyces viridochromogenes DSM 40736]
MISVAQLFPDGPQRVGRDCSQSTGSTDTDGGLPVPESACAALNRSSPTPDMRMGAPRGSRSHSALPAVNPWLLRSQVAIRNRVRWHDGRLQPVATGRRDVT